MSGTWPYTKLLRFPNNNLNCRLVCYQHLANFCASRCQANNHFFFFAVCSIFELGGNNKALNDWPQG